MPVEQIAYEIGRDVFDLSVFPAPDNPWALVVTHAVSKRRLLIVPPTLPPQKYWVNIAGAAVNDWVREQGVDKARDLLRELATPLPAPRRQGRVRKYFTRLVRSISSLLVRRRHA